MVSTYSPAIEKLKLAFEAQPGAPSWLDAQRRAAWDHIETNGFPTPRAEEWKYTDIAPAINLILTPLHEANGNGAVNGTSGDSAPSRTEIEALIPLGSLEGHRLVFVNGDFAADLSHVAELPEGVRLEPLSHAIASHCEVLTEHFGRALDVEDGAFIALNTAFSREGAFIRVPAGVTVEAPIHLVHITTRAGLWTHPRTVVSLGRETRARLVESFVSTQVSFSNPLTEIVAGAGSHLQHLKLQEESDKAFHVGLVHLNAARDSRVSSHCLNFGGRIVRNNSIAVMSGENAEITLNGLVVAGGQQHIDNHTTMDHALPHCRSHEVYAHVMNDQSTAVFNGKIMVRLDAQKTDAKQSNRTVLLSPEASVNAKPQLEIFADDVRCTHGATIGQLDENALFYLRARGVPEVQARTILIRAFAAEVLEGIDDQGVLDELEARIAARLR